jgi:hypothetical protein
MLASVNGVLSQAADIGNPVTLEDVFAAIRSGDGLIIWVYEGSRRDRRGDRQNSLLLLRDRVDPTPSWVSIASSSTAQRPLRKKRIWLTIIQIVVGPVAAISSITTIWGFRVSRLLPATSLTFETAMEILGIKYDPNSVEECSVSRAFFPADQPPAVAW